MNAELVARELVTVANLLAGANKFKVWIENMDSGKESDLDQFDEKGDAKKYKRELMKKHKLQNHAGHVVNYGDRKELFTNF